MSPISTPQKLINLVDEFGEGDCGENKMKRAFPSTKEPTGANYLSFNYVNHTASNIVSNSTKNVSNHLTPDAKMVFNQLCQVFTKAPIF